MPRDELPYLIEHVEQHLHGAAVEDVIHAADEAVYKAKAKGRDRVVVAGTKPRRGITVEAPSQPQGQIDRESRPASETGAG